MTAETDPEAARLFASREMWRLGRDRGLFVPLPSPEEAAAQTFSDAERLRIERLRGRALYGTPAVVGSQLRALASEYGVEEIAILTTLHSPAARQQSYTLLAHEFGLCRRTAPDSLKARTDAAISGNSL